MTCREEKNNENLFIQSSFLWLFINPYGKNLQGLMHSDTSQIIRPSADGDKLSNKQNPSIRFSFILTSDNILSRMSYCFSLSLSYLLIQENKKNRHRTTIFSLCVEISSPIPSLVDMRLVLISLRK